MSQMMMQCVSYSCSNGTVLICHVRRSTRVNCLQTYIRSLVASGKIGVHITTSSRTCDAVSGCQPGQL
eukprot:3878589-Amphidinium_carterae.1